MSLESSLPVSCLRSPVLKTGGISPSYSKTHKSNICLPLTSITLPLASIKYPRWFTLRPLLSTNPLPDGSFDRSGYPDWSISKSPRTLFILNLVKGKILGNSPDFKSVFFQSCLPLMSIILPNLSTRYPFSLQLLPRLSHKPSFEVWVTILPFASLSNWPITSLMSKRLP